MSTVNLSINISANSRQARRHIKHFVEWAQEYIEKGGAARKTGQGMNIAPLLQEMKKAQGQIQSAFDKVGDAAKGASKKVKSSAKEGEDEVKKWHQAVNELIAAFDEAKRKGGQLDKAIQGPALKKAHGIVQTQYTRHLGGEEVDEPQLLPQLDKDIADRTRMLQDLSPALKTNLAIVQEAKAQREKIVKLIQLEKSGTQEQVNAAKSGIKDLQARAKAMKEILVSGADKSVTQQARTELAQIEKKRSHLEKIVALGGSVKDSLSKTGVATDKNVKATKNWWIELTKLKAAYRAFGGEGSTAAEGVRKDMGRLLDERRRALQAQGAKADPAAIERVKEQYRMVEELRIAHQKKMSDAASLTPAQERNKLLSHIASKVAKIQAINIQSVQTEKMSAEQKAEAVKRFARLKEEALKTVKAIGLSDKQLKKMGKNVDEVANKLVNMRKAGKGLSQASSAEPDSMARKRDYATEVEKMHPVLRTIIHPEHSRMMNKARAYMADVKKYALFQMRWFASATSIFAIAGAITAAAKATLEFYQSLKDIQAVTGTSDKEIRLIGDAAIYVAKTTPIAASQASKMGLKLIQAGLDADQAAEAMKTVAAVVTVSGENMETVSKAVTTAMFAWNLGAEDIPKIGNAIAAALNFSRLTVEDLGTAFNYLAANSSIMGRSLEETLSIMAQLSNMGIRASTVGTGMSQLMTRLLVPSVKLRKELRRINVSANDVNPTMNKFSDIIKALEEAGFGATKSMALLGDRAGRQMAAALTVGSGAFEDMEKKIRESTQLQKGLDKAMEGPLNALKNMRNELEIAAIQIGDAAVPALGVLITLMKAFFAVLRNITYTVSFLSEKIGGLTVAIVAGLIPALIAARRHIKGIASVTTILATHPIIRAVILITGGLAALGYALGLAKDRAEKLADAHNKLGDSQAKNARKAEELKKVQQQIEAVATSIKEAWEATEKYQITIPFVQDAHANLAIISAYSERLKELEDRIKSLKDTTAGSKGPGWVVALKDFLKKFSAPDKKFPEMTSPEQAVFGNRQTVTSTPTVTEEEKNNAELLKLMAEREKLMRESYARIKGEADKFLKIPPGAKAQDIIDLKAAESGKIVAERYAEIREEMEKRLTISDDILKTASDELTLSYDMKLSEEERGKAYERMVEALKQYSIQIVGIAKGWNEIGNATVGVDKDIRDFAGKLDRANKETLSLKNKLEDLRTTDPFEKIAHGIDRQVKESEIAVGAITRLQKAVWKDLRDAQTRGEDALIVKYQKQYDILAQLQTVLGVNIGLVKDEGNELVKQEKKRQSIAYTEIAKAKMLRGVSLMQAAIDSKRNAGLLTSIQYEQAALNLKKKALDAEIGALRVKIAKSNEDAVALAALTDQLSALKSQRNALDDIAWKSKSMNDIERSRLDTMIQQAKALTQAPDTSIMDVSARTETYANQLTSAAESYVKAQEEYRKASTDQREGARLQMEAAEYSLRQAQYATEVTQQVERFRAVQEGLATVMGSVEQYQKYEQENPYRAQYDAAVQYYNDISALRQQGYAVEQEEARAAAAVRLADEQSTNQLKIASAQATFGALAGLAQSFYALSQGKSKSAFKFFKAFAIAEATISTYKAANDAMAWGTRTGSPILGAIWAASTIAAGLARVMQIKAMEPGMGAAGGGASASAATGGGGDNKYNYYEPYKYGSGFRPGETGQSTSIINYQITGDVYAQDSDEFQKKVVEAVQQDIKYNGETKDVINEYT